MSGQKLRLLEILAERFPKALSPESLGEEVNGGGAKWAAPVCAKLALMGLVGKDALGHYRITEKGVTYIRTSHGVYE